MAVQPTWPTHDELGVWSGRRQGPAAQAFAIDPECLSRDEDEGDRDGKADAAAPPSAQRVVPNPGRPT